MKQKDEQIKKRLQKDDETFFDAFFKMAGVVMPEAALEGLTGSERQLSAIAEVFRYYRVEMQEMPKDVVHLEERLDYLLRPSGMMRRTVTLDADWYHNATGAMLAQTKEGVVVALLPAKFSGYVLFDPETGTKTRVTKALAAKLLPEAICFYRPLPTGKIGLVELARYVLHTLSRADIFAVALAALIATLIGLLVPYAVNRMIDDVTGSGEVGFILPVACLMIGATISAAIMGIIKNILLTRIQTKLGVAVQAAAIMRIVSFPPAFFRDYSAGDITARLENLTILCNTVTSALLTTGFSALFSLVYIAQIFVYAPVLAIPAAVIVLATSLCMAMVVITQTRMIKRRMEMGVKTDGMVFGLITGIQKIKTAGAEKRAFSKWAAQYAAQAKTQYDPPLFLKIGNVVATGITLAGTIVIYALAVKAKIPTADFMAFYTSYGMVTAAFASLFGVATALASIRPVMELIRPILTTAPEMAQNKKAVTTLNGEIELDNISFRYQEDTPFILDNFSLKIREGEYLGVVGKTGCGKSTLMRLMLGFEAPCKGAIYYDQHDIASIDLQSLRRKIGVVMQSGKLFSGDIFSNITISAPWLTLEEAWKAAELAGIAEDIKAMPMGMNTLISEGSGGISSGQKQRLMIARAVAGSPAVLMFDEATSALDNLTQKQVANALSRLKCTRMVIAHRLSTVRDCDRIIVLEQGRIVEQGSYRALMKQNGFFAELVHRQQIKEEII